MDDNGNVVDFTGANHNSKSFKYKQKITGGTGNSSTKNIKIMISLKCLSNFWRTLEMSLINCEINLILTWYKNYVIAFDTAAD